MAPRRPTGTAALGAPGAGGTPRALAATALCLGSALAWSPGTLHRFVLAKLLVLALGVLVAAAAPPAGRLPRPVVGMIGAGSALLLAAALAAPSPAAALVGRWPRYEGLIALPLYLGAAWSGARLHGPDAPRSRAQALRVVLVFIALLLGAASTVEALGARPLGGDVSRPGALLGNAGDQGVLAAVLLVALLALELTSPSPGPIRRQVLHCTGLLAAATTVVVSGSRAALVAAVVGLVLLPVLRRAKTDTTAWSSRRMIAWCGMIVAVLVVAALALPTTRDRLSGADPRAGASAAGRLDLLRATAGIVRDAPWAGAGPSGFVDAAPRWLGASWWAEQGTTAAVDSPHSWPAQAAAAGGVPLLLLACAFAAVVLRTLWHRIAAATPDRVGPVLAGAVAVVVAGVALFGQPTSAGTVPTAAFLAGAALARPAVHGAHSLGQRAVLLGVRVTSMALAATLACGLVADRLLLDAYAAAERGDAPAAAALLDRADRWRPWDRDLDLLAASVLTPLAASGVPGAVDLALDRGARAERALPDSAEAAALLATAHLADDDPSAALEVLGPTILRAPRHPELRLLEGLALAMSDDLAAAEAPLRVATGSPATGRRAWSLLADVLDGLGRPAEAAEARRRSVS